MLMMLRLIDVDDFVGNLWKVHLDVKREGYVQPISLGLFRSDYMLHIPSDADAPSLKQVEFNTISSSFGGLATVLANLHTELLSFPEQCPSYPSHPVLDGKAPPPNHAIKTLGSGLASAHEAYGPSKSSPALPTCILFVVQDGERNIFDQLHLSSYITGQLKIPIFRVTNTQILEVTSISDSNSARPLIYTPPHSPSTPFEVSTVYLRALYAPTDYTSPSAWTARTHLERSAAIKCPTVLTQLAGCKKIQQVLADPSGPDHLSAFLPNTPPSIISKLRSTFAPQYAISDPELDCQGRELALNPETALKHVLKPQREGGGNNIYKANIPPFLQSISEAEYKRWVLMELIQPPPQARNVVLKSNGTVVAGDTISELGIFGTALWKQPGTAEKRDSEGDAKSWMLANVEGGWLLRTKAKDSDEGGVAAGFSCLDTMVLVD